MTQLVIKQTRELILAGEISEAEANLVVLAEKEGDHALVEVLDEMAPKDVLAVMREYDASKESIVNLVVSPDQFVRAIVLERQYGEPIEKYVPRLRNTMNAVMHRSPGACSEVLDCLAEHDEGVRLLGLLRTWAQAWCASWWAAHLLLMRLLLERLGMLGAEIVKRGEGVSFRNDIVVGPGGSQILVEDPSGNVIELFQSARSR